MLWRRMSMLVCGSRHWLRASPSLGLRLLSSLLLVAMVVHMVSVWFSPQPSPRIIFKDSNGSHVLVNGRVFKMHLSPSHQTKGETLAQNGSGDNSTTYLNRHPKGVYLGNFLQQLKSKREREEVQALFSFARAMFGESDARFAERHWYRNRKDMITEMNNTKFVHPWGPNLRLLMACMNRTYSGIGLRTASIIISFHDHEQLSLILHTVHSVVQRTPKHLLKEIILIDDNSRKDDLNQVLRNYIQGVFGSTFIRLFRSKRSLGLIRARNMGAQMASGDVIVCMDSHMEVQERWLEALLLEIHKNPKTLATSYLDWFEPPLEADTNRTWLYKIGARDWVTYFDWTFGFGWQTQGQDRKNASAGDPTVAVKSPITIGTIWAMERRFFLSIGAFDEGMVAWGGENLDLPIRVWLFGGRVVNVPCSVAAHYEGRGYRDYRAGWEPFYYHNYKRVTEVWFDDYKHLVYRYMPYVQSANEGDISDRLALKRSAKHDMRWFLDNVFPELGVPDRDAFGWGGTQNIGTGQCLDSSGGSYPSMYNCTPDQLNKQNFMWYKNGLLVFNGVRIQTLAGPNTGNKFLQNEGTITSVGAPKLARWLHWKGGPIVELHSKLCLKAPAREHEQVLLVPCDLRAVSQQWRFTNYTSSYEQLTQGLTDNQTHPAIHQVSALVNKQDWDAVSEFLFGKSNATESEASQIKGNVQILPSRK